MRNKIIFGVLISLTVLSLYWYAFVALKEFSIPQEDIIDAYTYEPLSDLEMEVEQIEADKYKFSYKSFDGAVVNGQLSYPSIKSQKYPVFIGVSAMGRGYQRWWVDSFKGRPTVSQVNKITSMANNLGYAVIAIDARYHGTRKDPDRSLQSIMNDLNFFGNKDTYESMIKDTVLDYRVLIDWINQQQIFDNQKIVIGGYSMGGQVALLAASTDHRIERVLSIVPPHLDDKVALVAPKNFVSLLEGREVLLVTANDDENATKKENQILFDSINTSEKLHITFEGDHILPDNYVSSLEDWLTLSDEP
ncbi:MAG: alpha/beta fold hydrolase [Gammaproteobacteria bacterium]|nr:alpha/beta fold hydrolase [Gammaproteobacteria bacterium]